MSINLHTTDQSQALQQSRPLVQLRNVHLAFGNNEVLKGIDMDIHRGQAVSIIGPSGSGKSTILRCMTGLVHPQQGEIHVGGINVRALSSERALIQLRKNIGFVFQQYNLFPHLTVLQNLTVAPIKVAGIPREQAQVTAFELLRKVRLEGKENAYPGQLSGGQQQRVAIARALAMSPDLILFDEVTSALDPETVGEVLTVIRDLVRAGMTCVLVTHEMRFAEEISDEVYFTEAGRIVECGSARQIFHAPQSPRTRVFLQRALGQSGAAHTETMDVLPTVDFNRIQFSY